MRYLVAGGAGFIGSHLCDALIDRGDEVVCIDNLTTGRMENIGHHFKNPRFAYHNWLHFDHKKLDGVFHLASPAAPEDIKKYNYAAYAMNTDGARNLINYANEWGGKFLFVSTMKVHGDCDRVASYIRGKRAGEEICKEKGAKVARLASVYGPRMRLDDSRVIPVFITKSLKGAPLSLWNGGEQVDSFCYIDDIVRALIAFMDSDHSGVVEFGSWEGISIIDLAKRIIDLTGSRSTLRTDEQVTVVQQCHNIPDLANAKKYFGWEPEIMLDDGLRRTIQDFQGRIG